jgi:hypothetical protein
MNDDPRVFRRAAAPVNGVRASGKRLRRFFLLLELRILLAETLDAAGRIDQFLLAREKRVAIRADFH